MTLTTTRRSARNRRSVMAFVIGIAAVEMAATTPAAEASPFVIHVAVSSSSGGGGGSSQGGGGSAFGGGAAPLGAIGGTSGLSPRGSLSRSQSQSSTSDGAAAGSDFEDPLSGLPLGPVASAPQFPNTSPFGSTTGSVVTPGSGGPTSVTNGAIPGSVALLDLGGGESLSVSTAVADSLVAAWNDVVAASISNTENLANQSNSPGNDSSSAMNNVRQDNVIIGFPDLQTGLITFPGSLLGTSVAQGLVADAAAVTNPEPSTLILFGTGLIFVTRRFARRGRH